MNKHKKYVKHPTVIDRQKPRVIVSNIIDRCINMVDFTRVRENK